MYAIRSYYVVGQKYQRHLLSESDIIPGSIIEIPDNVLYLIKWSL